MNANASICAKSRPEFSTCIGAIIVIRGDNRWIKLAELIPWDELEDDYASQFCKGFGAPAKPFRMALGHVPLRGVNSEARLP